MSKKYRVTLNTCPLRGLRYYARCKRMQLQSSSKGATSLLFCSSAGIKAALTPAQQSKSLYNFALKKACKASTNSITILHTDVQQLLCEKMDLRLKATCRTSTYLNIDFDKAEKDLLLLQKLLYNLYSSAYTTVYQNAIIISMHNLYEYLCLSVSLYTFFLSRSYNRSPQNKS